MLRCLSLPQRMAAKIGTVGGILLALCILSPIGSAAAQSRPEVTLFAEDIGLRFTSNAFFSEKDAKADLFASPGYGIRVRGDLTSALSYSFASYVSNTRYQEHAVLDDDTVVASAGLTYKIGSWALKAGYSPSWIFERGFEGAPTEFRDLSTALVGKYPLGNVTASPIVSVRRRFSNVEFFESTKVGGGIEFGWNLTNKISFALAPGIAHTIYDTTPIVGNDRRDTFVGLNAELAWELHPSAVLVFSMAAGHNESTLDRRSWNSFGASPTVNLSTKF